MARRFDQLQQAQQKKRKTLANETNQTKSSKCERGGEKVKHEIDNDERSRR
jgi:hypothetical protein